MDPYMYMAHLNMNMNTMVRMLPQPPRPARPPPPRPARPPPPMIVARRCTHPTLKLMDFDESFAFTCDGCEEMGYGICYVCTAGCDYQMHEECVTASPRTYHPFYDQRLFTFQREKSANNSTSTKSCKACGMAVKGVSYTFVSEYGYSIFLHPCCMKLPHSLETDDGDILVLKKRLESRKCQYCDRVRLIGGQIKGWAYVSTNEEFVCHVKCMKDMLYEDWCMYAHMEDLEGPWWFSPYGPHYGNDDDYFVPWVGSSYNSSSSEPTWPGQQQVVVHHYYYAGQPQNNLAFVSTRPTQCSSPASASVAQPTSNHYSGGQHDSLALVPSARPTSNQYNGGQNNSLAVASTRPTGKKRKMFWKLTKAAVKLFIHSAVGNPLGAIEAVHNLF